MQHPDEGMIHTWLDGQLGAAEAAELEAHVAACPECATRVAEARGFTAGASRILNALDDVPRGVVPASATRDVVRAPAASRLFSRSFLQAAAAVLVVVTGGVIAVRVAGNDVAIPSAAKSAAARDTEVSPPANVAVAPVIAAPNSAAPSTRVVAENVPQSAPVTSRSTAGAVKTTTPTVARRSAAPATTPPPPSAPPPMAVATSENSFAPSTRPRSAVVGANGAVSQLTAAGATAPSRDTGEARVAADGKQVQLQNVVTTGVASADAAMLTVLRSEVTDGVRRTFLRTESGKVAVLTESSSPPEVPTDLTRASAAVRGPASAPMSVSSTRSVVGVPPGDVRTIKWRNPANGKLYSLSGPLSYAELDRVRVAVEADTTLRK